MTDYSIAKNHCRTCHWWHPNTGQCRRRSPERGKRSKLKWPITGVYCWCGDYKRTKHRFIEGLTQDEFWARVKAAKH